MRPNGGLADSSRGARRRVRALRPVPERLEGRQLLAVDLTTVASTPLGVQHWGATAIGGAGYKVSDVGDTNGDNYDDYVITAPTITTSPPYTPSVGVGSGQAFLVFGSRQVNQSAISDFLNLATPGGRTSDLAQLGSASPTNPATGLSGFPFAGVPLTVNDAGANLGMSVTGVGDINGDGRADFLIGAPGYGGGTGRAYLVYGNTALTAMGNGGASFNLDTTNASIQVQTFTSSLAGGQLGRSVAGVGNFLRDGTQGIAIGAPQATSPGATVGAGAVYVISYRTLSTLTSGGLIDANLIGQSGTGGLAGVRFVGTTLGGNAGFSIAPAGNVNGDAASAGTGSDDLLIGEPNGVSLGTSPIVNGGDAYLIYGAANLQAAQSNLGGGQLGIPLSQIGGTSNTVPGARFYSPTSGSQLGFSVSTAGDFDGDGLSDFLLGAPGRNNSTGRATLVHGEPTTTQISGTYDVETLTNPPSPQVALNAAYLDGNATGNLLGYALTPVGDINGDGLNEIAIGAPGTSSNAGAAFLIPGNPTLPDAAYTLSTAANPTAPLFALPIVSTQSSNTPLFLGASLGARLWPVSAPPIYVDGDSLGDFLIGAPGFSPTGTTVRQLAGTAYLMQGAYLAGLLPVPPNLTIGVQIGVGSATAPFSINASTPNALQIWVSSNATVSPTFQPTTMLSNPTTVTVNGVTFSATVAADGDFNNDGITDAILTISPRSRLNLTQGTTVNFTVAGQTNEASPRLWAGSASVAIAQASNPVVLPGPGINPLAAVVNIPHNGEMLVPTVAALSKLMYTPIPAAVATQQFKSGTGFSLRLARFYGLVKTSKKNGTKYYNQADRGNTLGYGVFARGKYKVGQVRFKGVKTGVYNG